MIKPKDPSRRKFVTDIGLASAGFAIVPRHVLGKGFEAPSDTLNVAFCGVGGQGRSNMINLASQNIVALCDVDWEYANKGFESLEKDRKSTRLNSSHGYISYAVFCLKKKKADTATQVPTLGYIRSVAPLSW